MKKRDFYFYVGVFFIFLQLIAIVRNFFLDFVYFFWFCDFVPLILAISFFLKKEDWIKGIINIGLFPQLIYIFGFLIRIFGGVVFLDDIELILTYNIFIIFSSIFLHLATLFAFYFTYKIKPSGRSLVYSALGLVLIYSIVLIFTAPVDSINYVFLLSNFFGVDSLSIFWIPLAFFIVALPTFWFQRLVYGYFVEKK